MHMALKLESLQRPSIHVVEGNRDTEAIGICLNMVWEQSANIHCVCVCEV